MIEKTWEFNKPVYLCFIDYEKAFDNVNWRILWSCLEKLGVPKHLIALLKSPYEDSSAQVRVEGELTPYFKPAKGVRQGCILSPILFNAYGEWVMREALDGWEGGVSLGGKRISDLRYADDTTLLATTIEELRELLPRVEAVNAAAGLRINKSKTKIMIVDRTNDNQPGITDVDGIEVVQDFTYLGPMVSNRGGLEGEIRRAAIAKAAVGKLNGIWKKS